MTSRHLGEDETDVLGALGDLEPHQPLGGDDERYLIRIARHPVDRVDERRDLWIGSNLLTKAS